MAEQVCRLIAACAASGVWILGRLVLLQNEGGIDVGQALKGPISNVLNDLAILIDEPFRIGSCVCVDDVMGTVEGVGIRSTMIRSLSGERLMISNEDLLGKAIQNYGDLPKQRVATTIGVVYQTSLETIKAIPALVEAAIRSKYPAEFDRCHFTGFADSTLEFEFVYFIPAADMVLLVDHQQEINHAIMEIFQKHGIEFAYPSQAPFLESAQVTTRDVALDIG